MFVQVEVFALIVGLLYACGVRRLYGLWRVCLSFSSFLLLSSLFLLSSCSCPASRLGFFSWSYLAFLALWVWRLAFFPFRTIRKKKGRSVLVRPRLSCCGCVGCYPVTTILPASTLYSMPATLYTGT